MLETLDYTIRIGYTPTILYIYIYILFKVNKAKIVNTVILLVLTETCTDRATRSICESPLKNEETHLFLNRVPALPSTKVTLGASAVGI